MPALDKLVQYSPSAAPNENIEALSNNPTRSRRFFGEPQTIESLVAAITEPLMSVIAYLLITWLLNYPLHRPDATLCLIVFALTFPGKDRFHQTVLSAAVGITFSWICLFSILALGAHVTRSLDLFDQDVLILWAVATPLISVAAVWGLRGALRLSMQAGKPCRAVVIGAGPLGLRLAHLLRTSNGRNVELLGHFEDRNDDRVSERAKYTHLGGLDDVAAYVERRGVQNVYITLPLGSQPRIIELLERLQGTTASLFFAPDVFGISIIQGRLQDLGGMPIVGICETPFTGINGVTKRLSDIVLASVILVMISPLLLLIAMGVKASSPGPVIFRQRRNGLDGSEIIVYKFRSMTAVDNGPVILQASRKDARITPFGSFMRKTSLDELPQFFNVLQGRMSIVGPRPHAVAHNEEYRKLIKAYMVRHKVKPGITGWAQVNGYRGETETLDKMEMRVEYDLEYLRNWSLLLDLQIIAATIRVFAHDKNAH